MLQHKTRLQVFLLCLFTLLNYSFVYGQQLSLKVVGDTTEGFHVAIYNGDKLVVTNTEEFSLQLYNLDMSTVANMPQWTGHEWTGNEKMITLKRDSYIKDFDANLSVAVTYQVVNANIVKKTIELIQPSMPGMYYILQETSKPTEKPKRYVTF